MSANPAVHVNAMFFPGDSRVGTDEASRMGERTLEVLLAADTLPYGVALPVSQAEIRAVLWWLVPCALLVLTVWFAFVSLLGSISGAIRIARRARRVARLNLFLAGFRYSALGRVLYFLQRFALVGKISDYPSGAIAGTEHPCEDVDKALRAWADTLVDLAPNRWAGTLLQEGRVQRNRIGQWAEKAAKWEKRRTGVLARVSDCKGIVRTCIREDEEARSSGKTARERMDRIRNSSRDVQEQLEIAKQLQREAGEARMLGKRAHLLAGRADRWATRVVKGAAKAGSVATSPESPSNKAAGVRAAATEAMGTVAEALRRAARATQRDATALKAAGRVLRFEAACALQRIAGLRYETVRDRLACLIASLQEEGRKKRDHLATSFNRFGRVLAKFCTFSWDWRVVACGIAIWVAAVHGFIARVDDPILNVALSGVGEDVWSLVYIGLGAMVFLASALKAKEYSLGKRWEQSLLYWSRRARREGMGPKALPLLPGLKRRSQWAIGCYAVLLLMVFLTATSYVTPVFGSALDALRTPDPPPWNPQVVGVLTLDYVILLLLLVAFVLPAAWVLWHLTELPESGS
ncbi:MAG: hypothetical protein OXK77_12380 [Gemmatimonadota bacterium]|nr:hypothetical protein [Gemmatimonadota bacterium]MDE2864289.1 hypothetical protein [Gemmatimonadota bacterium]